MKKQILFIALSMILCKGSFSQIIFENGYLINDSNHKIECLIKNMDWKNNPTELQYRLFRDTAVHEASIEDIKEFAINNVSRYIRAKTNIDRSGDQIDEMTSDRNPALGIGYKHKDRYWMEIRYQSNREVLTDYVSWNSDYKTLSVIFGYLLF